MFQKPLARQGRATGSSGAAFSSAGRCADGAPGFVVSLKWCNENVEDIARLQGPTFWMLAYALRSLPSHLRNLIHHGFKSYSSCLMRLSYLT